MQESKLILDKVSVRFMIGGLRAAGLKEALLHKLLPPAWTPQNQRRPFWGLKEVSLSLKVGDRLGIIGHNGAGKSTLLKVMSRIYTPTQGNVEVVGRLAPLIEIGAGFHGELTGRENCYLNGAILGFNRQQITDRLDSVIAFSGLRDFFDTPVKYYSTGMQLRLAFTLATEIAPDILILDELYSGGDAAFIEKANQRLDRFISDSKILIFVAHSMEYVLRFCSRCILMDHGTIVASGDAPAVVEEYLARSRTQT